MSLAASPSAFIGAQCLALLSRGTGALRRVGERLLVLQLHGKTVGTRDRTRNGPLGLCQCEPSATGGAALLQLYAQSACRH
jgi:hypothetical protein